VQQVEVEIRVDTAAARQATPLAQQLCGSRLDKCHAPSKGSLDATRRIAPLGADRING
jgi:hypothetical protein